MKIWMAIEKCVRGKRALLFGFKPSLKENYKPNEGEHGKWDSWSIIGWIENYQTDMKLGECAEFELTPTGKVFDEETMKFCDPCYQFDAHDNKEDREPNNCTKFLCGDKKCLYYKEIRKGLAIANDQNSK